MNKLEPTYLRYVYDGLHKGLLNAENASALPQGFIGLFENEFPANISSFERTSLLKRLALWALFKAAVSTHLASEILQEDEEETKALIDTYSKWFNSPEPGKYILYHDRLRTYFLQKLSSHEIQSINETLISYLESALERNIIDESNEYALEHLASHMAVESRLGSNYKRLHEYVNNKNLFEKQLSFSQSFNWSQNALRLAIIEASRYKNEINLSISIQNSSMLYEKEQNQFDQVLSFIDSDIFEVAFERITRMESLNQLKILLYIGIDFSFGNKKTHHSKDMVLNKVFLLIKKYFSNEPNDKNWRPFIDTNIGFDLCVEFQKIDNDLSIIFSDFLFSFNEIEDVFARNTNYAIKVDILNKIQARQIDYLKEIEFDEFENLIEEIEVVINNLLFKLNKEIYRLDIFSDRNQTLKNIIHDIKLIHELSSTIITDYIRRKNNQGIRTRTSQSGMDLLNKVIISKYSELLNYLISYSEENNEIQKEINFYNIIIESYDAAIQLINEVYYIDNKINCLSDFVKQTKRNKYDNKLKDYFIEYYYRFQSINFKDNSLKIELLIKLCISNSKIINESSFQNQLFTDLKSELHLALNNEIEYNEKQNWSSKIYKLLIVYANELLSKGKVKNHDEILEYKVLLFKKYHHNNYNLENNGVQIIYEFSEIYISYSLKKIEQNEIKESINHINSYLLYLLKIRDFINWKLFKSSSEIYKDTFSLVTNLFTKSTIIENEKFLIPLFNNYIELKIDSDLNSIYPKEILLKILEDVDFEIISDLILKIDEINLSLCFISVIDSDKLSATILIDEFLDKLDKTDECTIETILSLFVIEEKLNSLNSQNKYENIIYKFSQTCSYDLDEPQLNFTYINELISKIQLFENSTRFNSVKESLNFLKIRVIKSSNKLLLNYSKHIPEVILNDLHNTRTFDSIHSYYTHTKNLSKDDCRGIIRENLKNIINIILDTCYETKSEKEFILIFKKLEGLSNITDIHINNKNYNIALNNLFDKLVSQLFPFVLLSNVIENKFAFGKTQYFDIVEDNELSYIINYCFDVSRHEYLKYLVPVEEQYQIADHDFEYAMLHVRSDEFDSAFDWVNKIEENSRRVKNLLLYYFVKIFIKKNQPNLIEKALQLIDDNYFIGLSKIEIIFSNQLNEVNLSLDNDLILFIKSLNYEWEKNSMINELILKSKNKENIQFLEKFKIEVVSRKYITECDFEDIENDYDFNSDDYYINFWSEGAYPGEIFEFTDMDEHVEKRREMHFLSKTKKGKEKLKLMKVGLLSHKFGDVSASHDIVLKDYDYCLNNTY